ncbi:hypothetical protein ILUMI_05819 [Ignelater luminosus]|uniref:Protein BCCIP homolog n=1 Tax=Ignelater luminosus TaxID=2038154 RepID=A0A8K0DCA8_IGNLU|nr:hypothetical protein ILUMI_05819 [Ignelater luminosus]
MASSVKKRALNKKSESENDSEFNMDEEIQADFEGRNPEVQDFNGIRQLLKQIFLKEHVDVSQLSDMIIAQEGIGSVLKQSWNDEDDDDEDDTLTEALDVFGVTTVVNLSSHQQTPVVQQLFELMQRLSKDNANEATKAKIDAILNNSKRIGLLINERFVNLPPKVADPLLTSLQAELTRMMKRDATYDFEYYVVVCKLYKSKGQKSTFIFSNAEEEVFSKEAEVSLEYSVASQSDTALGGQWAEGDTEMIPYRRILFIPGNKFGHIVQKVKEFVG